MLKFCSMQCVKIGNWLIKASSLDDQIMVSGFNLETVEVFYKMFYSEEVAFKYMEKLYDKHCKVSNR